MDKIKTRRTRSITVRELAEQEKRARELEEEFKRDQKRIDSIHRREKVKNFGRKSKKKDKPKGIPKNLQTGDCVLIKQGIGIVRYIGMVEGAKRKNQIYAGIELKDLNTKGLNDGCAFGIRYFHCKDKQGVFVRNVPKVLSPEKILFQLGKLNANLKMMSLEQIKLHEENARLDQQNEDLLLKFEAEKEKSKRLEIELRNKSKLIGKSNSNPLSRRSVAEDDEKLSIDNCDLKNAEQPASVSSQDGISARKMKVNANLERKKKALFRVASGDLWSENEVVDFEKQLQKELEKGKREQALMALDLPDFNAPDGDFVQWLTQRFQQFRKLESTFSVPDIQDPKVKRAILVVTRMLASFTQQINRSSFSHKPIPKSLLSSLHERDDDEESFSSSSESSTDDF